MASSGDTSVRVPIGIPVETNASEAASSVDELRSSIDKSRDSIKEQANYLKSLRGTSEGVKAAKDQLKASIERERQVVSDATLKILQQNAALKRAATGADAVAKSQQKLAAATKTSAKEQDTLKKKSTDALKKSNEDRAKAFGDALGRAHPRVAQMRDALKTLSETAANGGNLGLATMAAAGLTAAAIAAAAAVGALVYSLAKWAIKGADAARSMGLVREASTRSATDAKNLGLHIDQLALKVPTATENLNELAASLARSRLGGQVTVDTLNAVAQANAGIGDQAGAKLREIVERGRLVGRMFIGWQELQGTGIDVDDIAGSLAERMHVSVQQARQALYEGRVTLADGAAAMRSGMEKKLAGINLRKMMSIDGLSDMFGKLTQQLTKDINLEPAGRAVADFFKAFDQSTATGVALKQLVTTFGNGVVKVLEKGAPLAKEFLRGLIIGALRAEVAYLEFSIALSDVVETIRKPLKSIGGVLDPAVVAGFDRIGSTILSVKFAVGFLAADLIILEKVFQSATGWLTTFTAGIEKVESVFARIQKLATTGVGGALVDGIVDGVKGKGHVLEDATRKLAKLARKGFTDEAEIHSPSRLFRRDGAQLPAGAAKGVDDGAGDVDRAAREMVPTPRYAQMMQGGGSAGGASSGTVVHVHVASVMVGGGAGSSPSEAVRSPGMREAFTQMLKEVAAAGGFVLGSVELGG